MFVGRVVQFSYMKGSKSNDNILQITSTCQRNHTEKANGPVIRDGDDVCFVPLDFVFTLGYNSLEKYVSSIDGVSFVFQDNYSFSIPTTVLRRTLLQWRIKLTFDL